MADRTAKTGTTKRGTAEADELDAREWTEEDGWDVFTPIGNSSGFTAKVEFRNGEAHTNDRGLARKFVSDFGYRVSPAFEDLREDFPDHEATDEWKASRPAMVRA